MVVRASVARDADQDERRLAGDRRERVDLIPGRPPGGSKVTIARRVANLTKQERNH
jgi:hypothetical protein